MEEAPACNPSTQGHLQVQGHHRLHAKFKAKLTYKGLWWVESHLAWGNLNWEKKKKKKKDLYGLFYSNF